MSTKFPPCINRASSLAALAVLSSLSSFAVQADSLGVIQVESTTIDDKFDNKRGEPSSIGVISGEQIDAAHTDNVHQMLQSIPGLTTSFTSGDELKLHIRGVENQRYMGEKPGVAVVIDGVPVFERTGTVNIDMDNIESIKVIKGGASYLFGEDALSGAVIITTKRGAKYEGYTVSGEVGSFGSQKALARAGFANESANGHVQVSQRMTDGYWDDSASKADYINGKLQYYVSDSSDVTVGLELSDRYKNSHGKVEGVTAAEDDPMSFDPAYDDYTNMYNVNLAKYFVTYSKDFDDISNLIVNTYSYGDETVYFSSPNSSGDYRYANDYEQVQNGVKAEYRTGGDNLAWMAAGEVRDNSYENIVAYNVDVPDNPRVPGDQSHTAGEIRSNDITDEKVQAVYGEVKFSVTDPLVVTLNGRMDHIAYDYTDKLEVAKNVDKSFDVNSWRVGANYAVSSNMDFYGNLSTGFRAPTVEQLFSGTLTPTGGTDGNPDLEPETALNIEFGIRKKTQLFGALTEIDATIFQIQRDDYIMSTAGQYGATTGLLSDIYDNIGGMRNRGLELAITSAPSERLSWNLAYTYLDAKFTNYDNYNLVLGTKGYGDLSPTVANCSLLIDPANDWCVESYDLAGYSVPRVPDHHLNLTLRFKPDSYWTISGEMDSKSSYYADELNRIKIDPVTTFNLLANYDRKVGKNIWSYFARIDNVLDLDYYNIARGSSDANGDGVFDDEDISITVNQGRTFTAGVSASF
ncbi:MAG: TonB-dependent receptor [Gammaproteobacteria bacterium]|nr:TonB-dependent receptor [Gammaproteobacteria bacterium]